MHATQAGGGDSVKRFTAACRLARALAMAADRPSPTSILEFGRAILHDEARALDALANGLDGPFEDAVRLIMGCKGKLIVSGLGKSGHVGRSLPMC